ncbi:MAG: hypothetical protein VYD71_02980 [Bacteroidota bacterium]|nr:hypothetical protein [Bacteroidota bacterium]
MNKINIIKSVKLYSFILVLCYCISFIPYIIPHGHNHNHDESSYCESIIENIDQHTNCSHEHHLSNSKADCFLCDQCVIYNHLFTVQKRGSNDRPLIGKHYELCERLNYQRFINYSNKSPPLLI